jgi:hypothetical protein
MEHLFKFAASDAGKSISDSARNACGNSCGNGDINAIFSAVTNALMFLIGAIAVIMLIIGGLRFITANGDAKQVETARNTVLYSVIGLIVAMTAYAIVKFVAGRF